MERADLLKDNGRIFIAQGQSIAQVTKDIDAAWPS